MTGYPIQTPPRFTGSDGEKLTQCYAYLYQMSEELNLALASLLGQSESRERKRETAESRVEESMKSQYSALQTLITKNAGLVEAEMERLQLELKGRYVAASEFGRYVQELSQRIETDPSSLTQYYSFAAQLSSDISGVDEAFRSYRTETEGYIRTGIVYYDGETPVYGVAVGQGLESSGGCVVSPQFHSTFTAQKLSFWQGEVEVAYVSNRQLYITDLSVLGRLLLSGKWQISTENGFTVKWIGG